MKAAPLDVTSGMPRFYLRRPGAAWTILLTTMVLLWAVHAAAQAPPTGPADTRPLGARYTADTLGVLPISESIFSLADTAEPDAIVDRIQPGNSNPGSPARVGAHGSSWTQTNYRVGDVDVTNPIGNGAPLLIPGVEQWDKVDIATGIIPIDINAAGMMISLTPRRPASQTWMRSVQFVGSAPAMNADGPTSPPPISRVSSWVNGDLFLSGPLVPEKVSGLLSAAWTRGTRFERSDPTTLASSLTSVFANLVDTPSKADEVRVTAWVQRSQDAAANRLAFVQPEASESNSGIHLQTAWQHLSSGGDIASRLFAGYTLGRRSNDLLAPSSITADSVSGVPIPTLLNPGVGDDHVWTIGGRVNRSVVSAGGVENNFTLGLEFAGASSSNHSTVPGLIGELVDGLPARAWAYTNPVAISSWHTSQISFLAADTFRVLPSLTLNGGFRFESIDGSAEGNATTVSWRNILPRGGFNWSIVDRWHLSAFGQYGQYGHRLPLDMLAYGDPAAPTANVYRWTGGPLTPGNLGPLVERWGPGTGGDSAFSSIDPQLRRPAMHEIVLGFESQPTPASYVRLSAIGRRETNILGVVNVGVPFSSYSTIHVPDPGVDIGGGQTPQTLTFYNRLPSTYGADRYLLTNPANPAGDDASFVGAELMGEIQKQNLMLMAGITAGRSEEIAGYRGFGPLENDEGLLGDVFINPNAANNPEGRVFTERGYTIKTALSYQLPHDASLGLIARYQDGQHFARIVIEPDLNQGPDYTRAFRDGRTRFTFSMTVDARLQKGFAVGDHKLTVMIDAYNLFNQSLEVEEDPVTGPTSRSTTAVQPPRVLKIGIRLPF